eukprot:scaffold4850_cov50-Attheya_sp.AAC.6
MGFVAFALLAFSSTGERQRQSIPEISTSSFESVRWHAKKNARGPSSINRIHHFGSRNSFKALHALPPNKPTFKARPSTVGWKGDRLDQLTDWAVSDEANRPIICEYDPDGTWLWMKWKGTVLSMTVVPVCLAMALGATVDYVAHFSSTETWPFWAIPPPDDPFIQQLQGIKSLWSYQVTLCTFILTFFTQEAYRHYRTVYLTTRAIQGRINDICLLLTIGAQRGDQRMGGKGGTVSGYSNEASTLIDTCTRLIRLSHTFFWAATPTSSNGIFDPDKQDISIGSDNGHVNWKNYTEIGPLLLSADGLMSLVDAGELTKEERKVLLESGLPPSQYAYVLMEWVGLHAIGGIKDGTLIGDNGFEENLLRQFTSLRAEYFNIGDYAAGRMPLAYVQLVQILVDSLVVLAPLALYPELGYLSIPLSGLFTLFFKGQLRLSKSFLDPFGIEGFPGQNICVDVLVSELNFGAASRWVKSGEALPSIPKK